MRRPSSKPGSLLWAVAGAAGGALVSVILYAIWWLWATPGATMKDLENEFQPGNSNSLYAWILFAGLLLGFILAGVWKGNHAAFRVGRLFGMLSLGTIGAIVGAFAGILVYLLLWTTSNSDASLHESFSAIPLALQDPHDPIQAFLLGGALTGLVVTLYLCANQFLRGLARNGTGAVMGGLAGLVLYSVAYMLINYPHLPNSSAYAIHLAEAIYSFTIIEFGLVVLGAVVGMMTSRYSWRLYGTFTLTALLSVILGYVLYTINQTLPRVPPDEFWLSLVLFAAETVSLTMVVLYSFYTIDVATRKRWQRAPRRASFSRYYVPRVALHVPTYNEPPEIVIASLQSLLALDYPEDRYLVMVGDDSTKPECARPLQEFCAAAGISYHHRDDRSGYKAGALNQLLEKTPKDVDLIAVVDADYQVEPGFLSEVVGYFIDGELAWVQTPQDYRNETQSFLTQQYYLADKYFYRTVLPSRNEENSIIFCGTMGVLRKQALVEVGGWGEKYITEDAELSVRLLNASWKSLYVNKTYGRGLIPPTFEGYKKQHARWALGGGQVLRGHLFRIFFGRFSPRQRFDYLVGNMHWFEGLFILTITCSLLFIGWGDLTGDPILTHHSTEVFLIGLVPLFLLVDGFTRLHMVLRRSLKVTFGGTLRVLGMWFSVKFSNSISAVKGLLGFKIPFVRTSKSSTGRLGKFEALRNALWTTRFESLMAFLCFLTATLLIARNSWLSEGAGSQFFTRLLLAFWILYYSLMFGSAPLYAYKAHTTFSPSPVAPSLSSRIRSVA